MLCNSAILSVYRKFAAARNASKALAKGNMEVISSGNNAVVAWKMSYDGETVVVAHNFSGSVTTVNLSGCKTSDELVSNGVVSASGTTVTLGAYSSAVYKQ